MNRTMHRRRTQWLLGIAGLLCLLLFIACNANSERRDAAAFRSDPPVASPDGHYHLVTIHASDGKLPFSTFVILNRDGASPGTMQFECPDRFRQADTVMMLWDDANRVWVYSGDVGTFFWQRNNEGKWIKHAYAQSDVSAPPELKKMRPKQHPR